MDYKEKYERALERARKIHNETEFDYEKGMMKEIFPELAESEDERIRKALLELVHDTTGDELLGDYKVYKEEALAWLEKQGETFTKRDVDDAYLKGISDAKNELEKQGEQKPADKVEPKFHVGDWVVQENIGVYKIIEICESWYEVIDVEGKHYSIAFDKEYMCHLWAIQDAKEGDVVVDKSDGTIGIFQSIGHHPDGGSYNDPSYCFLHCRYDDGFFYADFEHGNTIYSDDLIPATKEQRDTLERAMTIDGYRWNKEELKLEKI